MLDRLKNKKIIVVGSATGIGAATVRRLTAEGASVCAADINEEGAKAIADDVVANGGNAFHMGLDIADESSVNAAIGSAVEKLGGLTGAHINAADLRVIMDDSDAIEELAVFDRTLAVNLRGHLLCTRAVLRPLLSSKEGAVVYTSSGAADSGEPVRPAYAVSKGGLNSLMRHVASRWGRDGLTANCVAPGFTITPEMESSGHLTDELRNYMSTRTPSVRLGRPEDLAG